MTTATSGVPTALVARFESAGTATAPEMPITLTIAPVAGGAPVVQTTAITTVSPGIYSYAWTPPTVSVATDYLVTWDPSGDDVAGTEVVTVLPGNTGVWATPEQVLSITGKNFTTETIALASSMINTFTGADPEMPEDAITALDRKHLRRATAWQCFMAVKPGLLEERENVKDVSSDSQRISRETNSDIVLHPLAKREIMALSWVGTRTVIVPPVSASQRVANFLNETSDGCGVWYPL